MGWVLGSLREGWCLAKRWESGAFCFAMVISAVPMVTRQTKTLGRCGETLFSYSLHPGRCRVTLDRQKPDSGS